MNFRIAQLDDLPVLNTISVKSKRHWGYPESWIEQWMDELTLDEEKFHDQNTLVAEDKSQIIGFCSIVENTESYEILHLWVLPEFIGKGHGKRLLEGTIEKFVRGKGKPIIVEADLNAEPFYRNQGFVTCDRVESFPPGRFLPVMKKILSERLK